MHYTIIYDATHEEFKGWSQLLLPVVFIALAIIYFVYGRQASWRFSIKSMIVPLFLCGLSLITGLACALDYGFYLNVKSAIRQSKYEITEGIVTKLHAPEHFSAGQHGIRFRPASFFVNDVQFRCWDKKTGHGRKNFFQQSDLLHDGMQVRIYYVPYKYDNIITRLEVAQ